MSEMSYYLSKGWLHWIIFGFICLSQIKLHWFTNSVLDKGSQGCEWWPCAWGRGRRSRGRRLLGDRETFGMVASALQRLSWVARESYFRYITPPWVVFHSLKKQFANRTSTYELPSRIHNYALVEVYKLRTVVTRRGKHVKVNGGMSCTIDLNNWWHKNALLPKHWPGQVQFKHCCVFCVSALVWGVCGSVGCKPEDKNRKNPIY